MKPKRWKAIVALPFFLPWLALTLPVVCMIGIGRAGEWIDEHIPNHLVGWPLRKWFYRNN